MIHARRSDVAVHGHVLSGETKAHRTARAVALHRATGQAQRRRRLPRQVYPRAIEVAYGAALASMVDGARRALQPLFTQLGSILEQAAVERSDSARSDAGSTSRMQALLDQARRAVAEMIQPRGVEDLARKFAVQTHTYQRIQLGRQVKAALGVDLFARDKRIPAIVDHFVAENVALNKSIPAHALDRVEQVVTRGVTSATPVDDLHKQISDQFGVSERRGRLIARDQVGKLYGQVNAYRQQDLGVTRFVWRTAGDERVREEHQALEGQTFSYDDPPSEGLPGEPIQCRCSAEPDFTTIRDLADDPSAPIDETASEPAPEASPQPVAPDRAEKWLGQIPQQALAPVEAQALHDYQGGRVIDIQEFARTGDVAAGSAFASRAEAQYTIKALDRAIAKGRTPSDAILFRGIKGQGNPDREGVKGSYAVGKSVVDLGYTSTSISPDIARDFAGQHGTLLEIEAAAGTRAAFVPGAGSMQEAEVLLGRKAKLEVLDVRREGNLRIVRARLR